MVPEPSIQARSHFSVDPGEIPDRGGIVLALLLGFVEKEKKKKEASRFTDGEEKLSGYTEGRILLRLVFFSALQNQLGRAQNIRR